MIIGVDYYGNGFDQQYYDTALPTNELDEITIGAGMYDELFISVDPKMENDKKVPEQWHEYTIMDADFNSDLEAGSIDGKGHIVTQIEFYRREHAVTDSEWQLVAQFPYDENYNLYTVVDRFVENHKTYEYAVVPLAKETMGKMLYSNAIGSEFTGTFISNLDANYPMNLEFEFSDLTYNTNMAQVVPLNGQFPIVSFGNANYRTGSITFLPITPQQEYGYTSEINEHNEFTLRKDIINFLQDGKAKVIRRDDGDVIVCVTSNVVTTPLADGLDHISTITFDFVEIGELDYNTMDKSGLIASAGKSVYTYGDEYAGDIDYNSEFYNNTRRRDSY